MLYGFRNQGKLYRLARTLQQTNEDFDVIQETYAKWYENTCRFIQLPKNKKKNHHDNSSLTSQVLHPIPSPVSQSQIWNWCVLGDTLH